MRAFQFLARRNQENSGNLIKKLYQKNVAYWSAWKNECKIVMDE